MVVYYIDVGQGDSTFLSSFVFHPKVSRQSRAFALDFPHIFIVIPEGFRRE
jgi:hypothetical protein